jgi:Protein of unknown function (DUF2975)
LHSKLLNMKIKTETILTVSKYLALMGGVWNSILWGSQLLTLISSFINPEWAKHTYMVDLNLFSIRDQSIGFYVCGMILIIAVSVLKALFWYKVFALLSELKLQAPFSREVVVKLERMAYILFSVWIVSTIFWKTFIFYLTKATSIQLPILHTDDEYLFMSGIIYIISQVFKRGIEIQEENQLTV